MTRSDRTRMMLTDGHRGEACRFTADCDPASSHPRDDGEPWSCSSWPWALSDFGRAENRSPTTDARVDVSAACAGHPPRMRASASCSAGTTQRWYAAFTETCRAA